MSTFRVELKKVVDDSYDIAVGYDLQSRFMEDIKSGLAGRIHKFAIITDSIVENLYARPIYEAFLREGFQADLFVFPTREDIWGLVINEAMAYGLPIITTDKCNAGAELIDGNGILVKSESPEDLANGIDNLINDNNELLARRSLEIIRGYSLEAMADRHINIFQSFVSDDDAR